MILFLDVISPKPKFFLIDNNKVIESLHILEKDYTRISDLIVKKFSILYRKYNFLTKLKYLIINSGPGSYTSLRVGISFMIGLSYRNNIPIYGISCSEFMKQFISKEKFYSTLLIIISSNDQNFIFYPKNYDKNYYKISKISEDKFIENIKIENFSTCVANYTLPTLLKKKINSFNKKIEYINFEDLLKNDFLKNLKIKNIIQPIYISDNKIFD